MLRGWNLHEVLTLTSSLPGNAAPSKPPSRGQGRGANVRGKPVAEDVGFAEGWKVYMAGNPRLRNPKTLSSLMRKGVPPELRGELWAHCLGLKLATGGEALPLPLVIQADAQAEQQEADVAEAAPVHGAARGVPSHIAEIIEADVARTFPEDNEFQQANGPAKLRRVLQGFAAADADLGYCQSLNFLAAVFLMIFHDERVTLAAVGQTLLKLGIRNWYTNGMHQLRADTVVLEDLMHERLLGTYRAFQAHKFDLMFVSSKWFLCLFATVLRGEALRRVWDVLLCDGIEAVFRVSLGLLALKAERIANATCCDELIFMFQDGPAEAHADAILDAAYDPSLAGNLTRADLSRRRQQAATSLASSDRRAEMRRQQFTRGGIRPASLLNRI